MTRLVPRLCCSLLAFAASAGATVLTYATPYGPNQTFSRADKTWMAWIAEKSGGSLTIRPIWSGGLISSDQSLIELRHGVADIGLITPIYAHGGAHLLRVQTGFYAGAKTFEQQVDMYRCLAADSPEYARELQGLKVLAIQGGTLPGLLSRTREVHTLDDLRGMRIRVPTELLNVMRDLGADPVTMPMGEVYSSLAKGVLDAVVAPTDTLKSLHFGEVAKFYTELRVPRGAYPARAMGERRWNALNPQEQRLHEPVCRGRRALGGTTLHYMNVRKNRLCVVLFLELPPEVFHDLQHLCGVGAHLGRKPKRIKHLLQRKLGSLDVMPGKFRGL